ncbi:MAG: hypothetical protein LBJ13_01800, partial [Puniceicoccales bacterium]|nr:hypothetical protein [Puniceicoccales bacterium]
SLFLRARGPYRNLQVDEDNPKNGQCDFEIKGEEVSYVSGECVLIANPTYDLTFKSLFTPSDGLGEWGDQEHALGRLKSLLNSIIYPEFEKKSDSEHIIKVELCDTESLKMENDKGAGQALRVLRCDIVCKCTIQKKNQRQSEVFFIYFDIEMQRADVPGRIRDFLNYRKTLQKKLNVEEDSMKVIAFLNYEHTFPSVANAMLVTAIEDQETGSISFVDPSSSIMLKDLSKLISLPSIVRKINEGNAVQIMSKSQSLNENGKEWLKLLGVQWWAQEAKDKEENHRYVVPVGVGCEEVKGALMILNHKGITDEALQEEYERIFGGEATARAFERRGREEGEKRKMIEMLMKNFIKGRAIDDDDVEEIRKKSLDGAFVRGIWESLNNAANKTEENYEAFLRELRVRNLMAE